MIKPLTVTSEGIRGWLVIAATMLMLKRKIENTLLQWKNKPEHTPLVI